jgi:broad specificity phosphatase PhoE
MAIITIPKKDIEKIAKINDELIEKINLMGTPVEAVTEDNIEDMNLKSIININYTSIIEKKDFKVLEDEENLEFRIKKFISYLFNEYPNKTILIVSHKGVINKIKDIYLKKTDLNDNFEMGNFETINIFK